MCQSMVNIQSPAAEIRRGKKKKKEEGRTNHSMKIYMVSLLHRATIKTVSGKVVEHSIAFRVVSIYWQGDDPFPLKSCLQLTCPLLSMVSYEMSELITQERIAVGSSNMVEGLTT